MRSTTITAIIIALLIGLWLASGQLGKDPAAPLESLADQRTEQAAKIEDLAPTRVRAEVIRATDKTRQVRVRGRTENKRTVDVRAEITGRILERPVERGDQVAQGDLLCRVSIDDRQAALTEAQAAVAEAEQRYESSLELKTKGFINELEVKQAEAGLASARAAVTRSRLNLARTRIRAPFDGFVEATAMEVGDYASPGSVCATIVDLNPMLLVGQVSEKDVMALNLGTETEGRIATGLAVRGPITFIGAQADDATRTYRVEVEVENANGALRSGVTTDILVPLETVSAHRVSPALFALDDDGQVGLRTVNDENRVEFHRVDIISSEPDGAWVTGLPEVATLITVGQELVVPGERVEISFEARREMPAAAPVKDGSNAPQSRIARPAGENNREASQASARLATAQASTNAG